MQEPDEEREDGSLDRKLAHIIRDYETTWSKLRQQSQQVLLIRGWSVTVTLAYMGLTITARDKWNDLSAWWDYLVVLFLPPACALLLFWFMEALTHSWAIFNRSSVIPDVDRLFYKEGKEFWQAVRAHRFLTDKESKKKYLRGWESPWGRFARGGWIALVYWHGWLLIALLLTSILLGPYLSAPSDHAATEGGSPPTQRNPSLGLVPKGIEGNEDMHDKSKENGTFLDVPQGTPSGKDNSGDSTLDSRPR